MKVFMRLTCGKCRNNRTHIHFTLKVQVLNCFLAMFVTLADLHNCLSESGAKTMLTARGNEWMQFIFLYALIGWIIQ